MTQYEAELRQIASGLGLRFDMDMQDWGRECSDPARVGEFVRTYFASSHSNLWVDNEYAELICSSADYAMHDGCLQPADLDLIARWIPVVWTRPEARFCLRFWARLSEKPNPKDPYPFGQWLRQNYERITGDTLSRLLAHSIADDPRADA